MTELPAVGALLDFLLGIPDAAAYALIGAGSALENIFPPVPSDTFVVLGAVLSDRGSLQPAAVLLTAWLANGAGALCVFGLARRHGRAIFGSRWGRWVLRPHQLRRMARFYERHGLWAIFLARFLPVLRVVVPTFAGFSGLAVARAALPIAVASLIWNGVMVAAGIFASRNVDRLLNLLARANAWLLVLAAVLLAVILRWWIRTRRADRPADAAAPAASAAEASKAGAERAGKTPGPTDGPKGAERAGKTPKPKPTDGPKGAEADETEPRRPFGTRPDAAGRGRAPK